MNPQKVYVITSIDGPTKIGISHQPEHRRMHLQSQFKDRRLELVSVIETDGLPALAVERKAHELLNEVRAHGEWFNVDAAGAVEAIDAALVAVREAGIKPKPVGPTTSWHLRITLESSAKQRIEELARIEKRSISSFVRVLLEKHAREKEKQP